MRMHTIKQVATIGCLLAISPMAWAQTCEENEHVVFSFLDESYFCELCRPPTVNEAGDDPANEERTFCDLKDEALVRLDFDAPNSDGDIALLSESGWTLSLKITVPYDVIDFDNGGGIFRSSVSFPGPIRASRQGKNLPGYVVFEDPDGCPAVSTSLNLEVLYGGLNCVIFGPFFNDSRYFEFQPDVDLTGIPDTQPTPSDAPGPGNEDLRALLTYESGSRGPEFSRTGSSVCSPGTQDEDCEVFGPWMGGSTVDGWGIGTDDDLPGLFVYTDKGIGLLWDEPEFELQDPPGVRNLAGMFNSISYEASDLMKSSSDGPKPKGKPNWQLTEEFRIWAHMNVLPNIFESTYQIDLNNTPSTSIATNWRWRVDGGPVEPVPTDLPKSGETGSTLSCIEKVSSGLTNTSKFTASAFMVSGEAPAVLYDYDGDGQVNVQDAIADPNITVISNETSISWLQIGTINKPHPGGMEFDLVAPENIDEPRCAGGSGASATRSPPR